MSPRSAAAVVVLVVLAAAGCPSQVLPLDAADAVDAGTAIDARADAPLGDAPPVDAATDAALVDGGMDAPLVDDVGPDAPPDDAPATDAPIVDCDPPDDDGDGHIAIACGGNDCDDSNPDVRPSATEVCNGIDDDCDGSASFCVAGDCEDDDHDGHADTAICGAAGDDCDDGEPLSYVGGVDVDADGIDGDCDGHEVCFLDVDLDGYLSDTAPTRVTTDVRCAAPHLALGTAPRGDCCEALEQYVDPSRPLDEGMVEQRVAGFDSHPGAPGRPAPRPAACGGDPWDWDCSGSVEPDRIPRPSTVATGTCGDDIDMCEAGGTYGAGWVDPEPTACGERALYSVGGPCTLRYTINDGIRFYCGAPGEVEWYRCR